MAGNADNKEYDERRDAFLGSKGFRVIRVWNIDLLQNIDGVMEMLSIELDSTPSP